MPPKKQRSQRKPHCGPVPALTSTAPRLTFPPLNPLFACRAATRVALAAPPIDLDYVSRRVKRHLNDLERSNYTEPAAASAGVNAAQQEEAELAKGMTALARDAVGEDGKGK